MKSLVSKILLSASAMLVLAIATWITLASKGYFDSGKFEVIQTQALSSTDAAMLVRRSDNTALSSDTYFVLIGPQLYSSKDLKKAFYSGQPVFVAGRAGLSIHIDKPQTLTITCNACGISPNLIEKQRFSDHGIAIRYAGFPS